MSALSAAVYILTRGVDNHACGCIWAETFAAFDHNTVQTTQQRCSPKHTCVFSAQDSLDSHSMCLK